jgi:hypothetical protein
MSNKDLLTSAAASPCLLSMGMKAAFRIAGVIGRDKPACHAVPLDFSTHFWYTFSRSLAR